MGSTHKRPVITAEYFESCTGNKPSDDDLERANCDYVGSLGHYRCGWNYCFSKPVFEVGPHVCNNCIFCFGGQ